jgi:defect-in-organelle-trafficking protein DotD
MNMRITKKIEVIGVFAALMLLTACHGVIKPRTAQEPQIVTSPDSVTVRLAEAADRASRSLETLAAVEQTRNPNVAIASIPNAPQELRRTMSLDWFGPVEQVTQTVAARAGYTFKVFGNTPPAPVIVTVKAQNRQLIDLLRDIGLQVGTMANLKVDARSRVVELYYPSALDQTSSGG